MRTFADNDYAVDYSLDYLQKTIDPARFFRINRNSIINIDAVGEILSYSSSRLKVKLTGHKPLEDLIVSRDKVGDFKKWIDR